MNASKCLLAAIFLTSGQALADGPLDICTTLATDTTGSLKAGYVSDGNELSTREFVLQYRNGKALVLASSGVCYPRVQTIARDVFLVSVENCGSAFLPEYWIARADRHTKSVVLLDYLSPYKFFAAEMKKDQWDTGHLRVRLLYAAQYQYPFQPAELGMLVSSRGFLFGKQVRDVPVRGADYRLPHLVLRDLYDAGFKVKRIAQPPCGVFSQQTRAEAAKREVDICRKREEIAAAIRYLTAEPAMRLAKQDSSGRLSSASCDSHVDSDNPYATGVEGSNQE